MAYTLDVELFISEVKKYPELWNFKNEDFKYKNRKQAAWLEIAKVFIQDVEDMTESEREDVCKKLNNKWRNIRDSFVRYMKRKDKNKTYMYAKHLSFLASMYKNQSGSEEDWSDDEENIKKTSTKIKRGEVHSDDDEPPSTIENLKRKRVSLKQQEDTIEYVDAFKQDPTCSYPLEDEDKSFFDSLLPAVRDFNLDQKLEFRAEVILLIKNIRNSNSQISNLRIKIDPSMGESD